MKLQPTMTEARARWLERLNQGQAARPRAVTAQQCMNLGWTEWVYIDRDSGQRINEADARLRWGELWFRHTWTDGEQLTPEGRLALIAHRERMAKLAK